MKQKIDTKWHAVSAQEIKAYTYQQNPQNGELKFRWKNPKKSKKLELGESKTFESGDITAVLWHNKQDVRIITYGIDPTQKAVKNETTCPWAIKNTAIIWVVSIYPKKNGPTTRSAVQVTNGGSIFLISL